MIGLRLDQAKSLFFDAPAVQRAVDAGTRRVLSRFGSFVRTKARDLTGKTGRMVRVAEMGDEERAAYRKSVAIAKRTGRPVPKRRRVPSRPGEPPRKVTGRLRQFLFFTFDPDRRSVVVGPARLSGTADANSPATLEYGGTAKVGRRQRSVRVEARPFMDPALAAELPKMPGLWRDAIR